MILLIVTLIFSLVIMLFFTWFLASYCKELYKLPVNDKDIKTTDFIYYSILVCFIAFDITIIVSLFKLFTL